jgi:cellobiose transport system substrate-binding protein
MELSRRHLIRAGLLGAAGVAAGGIAACGSSAGSSGTGSAAKALSLWYWDGGLSKNVVADAVKRFRPQGMITASVIGGDFKQRLQTAMTAGRYVPDITGIKGEDMPSMLPHADKFIDLNTLGAKKLAPQYLTWKWQAGSTADGKLIGFPIDIGPTGLFYREDIFAAAHLPTNLAAVTAAAKTWDDYFALGVEMRKAAPKSFLVRNNGSVFSVATAQLPTSFIDSSGKFAGDQAPIRDAWDLAVKSVKLGIDAKINDNSWNAAISNGSIATEIGAAWHALDIEQAAPNGTGKWRVAPTPGGPANIGGSFLALPKQCADPALAFEIITWILDPANQARGFTDAALFPSTPASYAMSALTSGDPYFGGQQTIDVFGPSAKGNPIAYQAPADAAVSAPYYNELTNVENGKSPDAAWTDAVGQAKQVFQQQQVS